MQSIHLLLRIRYRINRRLFALEVIGGNGPLNRIVILYSLHGRRWHLIALRLSHIVWPFSERLLGLRYVITL